MGQLRGLLKYRLSIAVLVTFIFLASGVHAQPPVLKTSVALEDVGALTQDFLAVPEVRQMIGTEQKLIEYSLGQGCIARQHSQAWVRVAGGRVFEVSATPAAPSVRGQPDFTISMPCSAGLSVLNSADKTRTVLSMLSKNVITVNARDWKTQALIRSFLLTDLTDRLQPQTVRGVVGLDYGIQVGVSLPPSENNINNMVVNQHGAPVGAVCNNHERFASPPPEARVTFTGPPGVLAQHPDTIKADPGLTAQRTLTTETMRTWQDAKDRAMARRAVQEYLRSPQGVIAGPINPDQSLLRLAGFFLEGGEGQTALALGYLLGAGATPAVSTELQKQGLIRPLPPKLREEDYNYSPDAIIL